MISSGMSGGSDGDQTVSSTTDHLAGTLTVSPINSGDADMKCEMQEEEEGLLVNPGSLLTSQGGYLVSPTLSNPTLQSLLSSPTSLQGAQLALPEGIQIITVSSPSDLLPAQTDGASRIWQVINQDNGIITVGDVDFKPCLSVVAAGDVVDGSQQVDPSQELVESVQDMASILMPPPAQPLPPGCPSWAARLKSCEKIGDYYRGYVDTEVELDILLTFHKQATQSFWGTRQSPSPAKQSTRFMWKSQYVPWDGVPFVNTGSRAVVMECQYGPRRKGALAKKQSDDSREYRQTCPARIYIKKVRKFPEYKIDLNLDKKGMKNAMDKAFHELKQQNIEKIGQDRFYVQLPLQTAHEYHEDMPVRNQAFSIRTATTVETEPTITVSTTEECPTVTVEEGAGDKQQTRLHPLVVQKIREIVAGGEVRVYNVRRLLRAYVIRELCSSGVTDCYIQRHDLTLFPTVTDLKNQIHEAVKDVENGTLPMTAHLVTSEQLAAQSGEDFMQDEDYEEVTELNVWPGSQNATTSEPVPETVTVTLTQSPHDDGGHVISRIETHLSDGTTQISTTLTPETAQLLARINPSMFPPGSLVQLQAASPDNQEPRENCITLNGASNLGAEPAYTDIGIESKYDEVGESLSIQTDGTGAGLCISGLDTGQAEPSTIMTSEGHHHHHHHHHLEEQNADLIGVAMVPGIPVQPDLEDIQAQPCEVSPL